ELQGKVAELAFRPPTRDFASLERGNAGAVIAPIFEPAQRLDQPPRDWLDADDADDAAHAEWLLSLLLCSLFGRRLFADLGGVAGFVDLPGSPQGQGVCRYVLGQHAARGDVGAVADRDGRDKRSVRADEGVGPDRRPVLVDPVVIAGDRTGADIRPRPDAGVADIGQVIDLGPLTDFGGLDLHEIADVGTRPDLGAGPQPAERPDGRTGFDRSTLDMAEGLDRHAVADPGARPEHHVRFDHHIPADLGVVGEIDCRRVVQRHAGLHEIFSPERLELRLRLGEAGAVVDAQHLAGVGDRMLDAHAVRIGELDSVGEVILALGVLVLDSVDDPSQGIGPEAHEPGVHQADLPLRLAGIGEFADGEQPAAFGDQPAIAKRVLGLEAHHDDVGAVVEPGRNILDGLRAQHRPVAVEHDDIALCLGEYRPRFADGMAGAEPINLARNRRTRRHRPDRRLDRLMVRSHDDANRRRPRRLRSADHVAEHRQPADLVQNLGQAGAHPRPFACRQDDRQKFRHAYLVWCRLRITPEGSLKSRARREAPAAAAQIYGSRPFQADNRLPGW